MTGKKKGCLLTLLVLVVLLIIAVLVALALIPGQVRFGGVPAKYVVAPSPVAGVKPGAGTTTPAPQKRGLFEVRYLVPDEMWQREVTAIFPITQDVSGAMKLQLSNPKFIRDSDGRFIRVALDLVARLPASAPGKTEDRYPGRAEVRTRLRYDAKTRSVSLAEAELVEFSFSGSAASYAAPLVPVLKVGLAAEMEGFVVVKLPEKGGFWQQTGISRVHDVVIEDGKVSVVVGP